MSQLSADCLNEIFEYLEKDKITLRSCLLVNRIWCEVSVRILWREIRNYHTLIACLPDALKEILSKNGIITSDSRPPPMFNYASFCKVLSVNQVTFNVRKFIESQQSSSFQNLSDITSIVTEEIFKFLIPQISLRKLYFYTYLSNIQNIAFPVTNDCLKNLSELCFGSDINP